MQRSFITNSASFLLAQYLSCAHGARGTCPSGWWLGFCSHCLSTCPRTRRGTSARATDSGRRFLAQPLAAAPPLMRTGAPGYDNAAWLCARGPLLCVRTALLCVLNGLFFRASFFFRKKTAQNLKIWSQKTKFDLIWGQGGRFRPYFALYRP